MDREKHKRDKEMCVMTRAGDAGELYSMYEALASTHCGVIPTEGRAPRGNEDPESVFELPVQVAHELCEIDAVHS